MAMAPDASWAVTVGADGSLRTWGTGAPRVPRRMVPIRGGEPMAVALSGDRIRVLWATGATIRLHQNVNGAFPRDDEFAAPAPVRALALSPSGRLAKRRQAILRMSSQPTGRLLRRAAIPVRRRALSRQSGIGHSR